MWHCSTYSVSLSKYFGKIISYSYMMIALCHLISHPEILIKYRFFFFLLLSFQNDGEFKLAKYYHSIIYIRNMFLRYHIWFLSQPSKKRKTALQEGQIKNSHNFNSAHFWDQKYFITICKQCCITVQLVTSTMLQELKFHCFIQKSWIFHLSHRITDIMGRNIKNN